MFQLSIPYIDLNLNINDSACPRNCVTPLRFCLFCLDRNCEMEGSGELIDVLN
jgi:hypothetical protein